MKRCTVWNRPGGPRLGLIGILRSCRRRGLAIVLIAQAFGVLYRRGQLAASCEADETNTASNALMARLSASRVGQCRTGSARTPVARYSLIHITATRRMRPGSSRVA
jgi:predicted GNAT superfamily acetyltransferase